jgi:hypothetical protein
MFCFYATKIKISNIGRVMKNTGYKLEYGRMPDGSGWLVKRIG